MSEHFNPLDMQRSFSVVLDFVRKKRLQVYPSDRVPRIPGTKKIADIRAFDQQDAERKAEKFAPKDPWPPRAA